MSIHRLPLPPNGEIKLPMPPATSKATAPPQINAGACWRSEAARVLSRQDVARPVRDLNHTASAAMAFDGRDAKEQTERQAELIKAAYANGHEAGERTGYRAGWLWGLVCGGTLTFGLIAAGTLVWAAVDDYRTEQRAVQGARP